MNVTFWHEKLSRGFSVPIGSISRNTLLGSFSLLLLSACTSFQSLPLGTQANLSTDVKAINISADDFPIHQLQHHAFDLTDGLDWVEISMLAVANNPSLKALRLQSGEEAAQVYAVGLLPDPQISADLVHPMSSAAGLVTGFDAGLGYNLGALITRSVRKQAASAQKSQVDLGILWQEWQVIGRARMLTLHVINTGKKLEILQKAIEGYQDSYKQSQTFLKQGEVTLDQAGAAASAWFDAANRLDQVRQQHSRAQHQLRALLGLKPNAKLKLASTANLPPRNIDVDEAALSDIPKRRPDLLALQAGYDAQQNRVRSAILAQFPGVNIGFSRGQDTDGLNTSGFGVALDLPLFSGARGKIAITRATRERLRGEYQARLDQSTSDIARLMDKRTNLFAQYERVQKLMPKIESLAKNARRAYQSGDMAALDVLNLETTLLDGQLEMIDLEEALWQVQIALDTLLAWPQPEGGA
jgi:outer membrane protein, heavy metal efflux system